MPIKGLEDRKRLPRLGKIHVGIKVKGRGGGSERPMATDYFVCPAEVVKVYGEKPRELHIMFPLEDESIWASQFYKLYSQSRGLMCKGDGEVAMRLVDIKTGALASRESMETEMREVDCSGRECPYYGEKCREVMMLQFALPDVPGLGVYQLDTSSVNSMININSAIEMIRGVLGRISWIPLTLVLEAQEVSPEGKKKTVQVLNLKTDVKLLDLAKRRALPAGQETAVSPPDESVPPLDSETVAESPPGPGALGGGDGARTAAPAAPKRGKPGDYPMQTLGDLFTACLAEYKMNQSEVLRELGISDKRDIGNVEQAWQTIQAVKGGK
jgi:hypothetical protein